MCVLSLPMAGGAARLRTALSYQLLLERVPGSTTLYLTLTNKGPDPIRRLVRVARFSLPHVSPPSKPHQVVNCDGLEGWRQYIIEMWLFNEYVQSVIDQINGTAKDGQPIVFDRP